MTGLSGNRNTPRRRTFDTFKPTINRYGSLLGGQHMGVSTGTSGFVPMFGETISEGNANPPSVGSFGLKHAIGSLAYGYTLYLPIQASHEINTVNRAVELISSSGRFAGVISSHTNLGSFTSDRAPTFTLLLTTWLPQFRQVFQQYSRRAVQSQTVYPITVTSLIFNGNRRFLDWSGELGRMFPSKLKINLSI
jgi:hypothetical protein